MYRVLIFAPLLTLISRNFAAEAKLVKYKNEVVLATLNVRTIREESKSKELVTQLAAKGIDIMGIQEHCIVHDEEARYRTIEGQFLITSTAWENKQQASCGSRCKSRCSHESQGEEVTEKGLGLIQTNNGSIVKHNLLMVLGDLNGHLVL